MHISAKEASAAIAQAVLFRAIPARAVRHVSRPRRTKIASSDAKITYVLLIHLIHTLESVRVFV